MRLFPLDIAPAYLTGLWRDGDHCCEERSYLVLLSTLRQLTLVCVDEWFAWLKPRKPFLDYRVYCFLRQKLVLVLDVILMLYV